MKDLSLESLFGGENLAIECPGCDSEFEVTFKEIMEDGSIVTCPQCNQNIKLEHDETTTKTLRDSNKALKEFEKTLRKLK